MDGEKSQLTDKEMAVETALFLTDPDNRDKITVMKCALDFGGKKSEVFAIALKDAQTEEEDETYVEITPLALVVNESIFKQLKPLLDEKITTNIKSENDKTKKEDK